MIELIERARRWLIRPTREAPPSLSRRQFLKLAPLTIAGVAISDELADLLTERPSIILPARQYPYTVVGVELEDIVRLYSAQLVNNITKNNILLQHLTKHERVFSTHSRINEGLIQGGAGTTLWLPK